MVTDIRSFSKRRSVKETVSPSKCINVCSEIVDQSFIDTANFSCFSEFFKAKTCSSIYSISSAPLAYYQPIDNMIVSQIGSLTH
ncbi:hypothetical protein D1872_275640 [compost metagenome]